MAVKTTKFGSRTRWHRVLGHSLNIFWPIKQLFNEKGILSFKNLYNYHMFMEVFKIVKFSTPISIRNLVKFLPRSGKMILEVPLVRLDVTKQNFAFESTQVWNDLFVKILENVLP